MLWVKGGCMGYVLIVEDDIVLARMYQKAMEIEGLTVQTVGDGLAALDKVKQQMPALMLLDIMMPKMSGYQVLDALRAEPSTKFLPVVILTNLHAGEDLQLATSKGANECVVKSKSDPMQVVAIAKKYLGQAAATDRGNQENVAAQPAAAKPTEQSVQPAPVISAAPASLPAAPTVPTAPTMKTASVPQSSMKAVKTG
jgi:CheY-like chemotaxis protein